MLYILKTSVNNLIVIEIFYINFDKATEIIFKQKPKIYLLNKKLNFVIIDESVILSVSLEIQLNIKNL